MIQGLKKLPPLLSEALSLRIFYDCDYQEISRRQEISSALARKRVQLARERLRTLMVPE